MKRYVPAGTTRLNVITKRSFPFLYTFGMEIWATLCHAPCCSRAIKRPGMATRSQPWYKNFLTDWAILVGFDRFPGGISNGSGIGWIRQSSGKMGNRRLWNRLSRNDRARDWHKGRLSRGCVSLITCASTKTYTPWWYWSTNSSGRRLASIRWLPLWERRASRDNIGGLSLRQWRSDLLCPPLGYSCGLVLMISPAKDKGTSRSRVWDMSCPLHSCSFPRFSNLDAMFRLCRAIGLRQRRPWLGANP